MLHKKYCRNFQGELVAKESVLMCLKLHDDSMCFTDSYFYRMKMVIPSFINARYI